MLGTTKSFRHKKITFVSFQNSNNFTKEITIKHLLDTKISQLTNMLNFKVVDGILKDTCYTGHMNKVLC